MGVETLCFCYDYAGESNEGNQVWNRHETVYDVSQCPDDFQLEEGCRRNKKNKYDTVRNNSLGACQVDYTAFTVVVPSQDGGESKQCQADAEQIASKCRISLCESCVGESGTIEVACPYAGYYQSKASKSTDNDGIDKGTRHGNETLFCRPLGLSGSGNDRCRT